MSLSLERLFADSFVVVRNGRGFKKLATERKFNPNRKTIEIDIGELGLSSGLYSITATSHAAGLTSEPSNAVAYLC